jgi:hypothetical protein
MILLFSLSAGVARGLTGAADLTYFLQTLDPGDMMRVHIHCLKEAT